MASPQLEDGYTRIANELLEAKAKARLSAAEHSVLDVVFRECYGRNGGQKECFLSFEDISNKTGLPESTTSWAITRLCRRNVLIRDRHTYPPKTSVQKDYELWKPQEIVGKKATRNCDESHKELGPLPQEISVSKKKEEEKNNTYYSGQHLQITVVQHENLQRAYPSVDLNSEYPRMDVYLDTRPAQARWKNFYQGARNWVARMRPPREGGNDGKGGSVRRQPGGDSRPHDLSRFANVSRKAAGVDGSPG